VIERGGRARRASFAAARRVAVIQLVAEAFAGEGEAILAVLHFGVGLIRDPLD
jgi:hypothetical protein